MVFLASRFEHRARAVSAHPHDDRLRDADSARPGDEAPPQVVEPEAIKVCCLHGAAEALLDVHPAGLRLGVHEDKVLLEPRGEGAEGLRSALCPSSAVPKRRKVPTRGARHLVTLEPGRASRPPSPGEARLHPLRRGRSMVQKLRDLGVTLTCKQRKDSDPLQAVRVCEASAVLGGTSCAFYDSLSNKGVEGNTTVSFTCPVARCHRARRALLALSRAARRRGPDRDHHLQLSPTPTRPKKTAPEPVHPDSGASVGRGDYVFGEGVASVGVLTRGAGPRTNAPWTRTMYGFGGAATATPASGSMAGGSNFTFHPLVLLRNPERWRQESAEPLRG